MNTEKLIRKLRKEWPTGPGNRVVCATMDEAADTIEALETQLAAARKALELIDKAVSDGRFIRIRKITRAALEGKP